MIQRLCDKASDGDGPTKLLIGLALALDHVFSLPAQVNLTLHRIHPPGDISRGSHAAARFFLVFLSESQKCVSIADSQGATSALKL